MLSASASTTARASGILKQLCDENLPLARGVYSANRVSGSNPEAYAHIISSLGILYNKVFTQVELQKIITDGQGDECIDAIYFHPEGYIDVFDFKQGASCKKTDIQEFVKSVEANILDIPTDYSIFKPVLKKALKKIHRKGAPVRKVRAFFLRGGAVTPSDYFTNEKKRLEAYGSIEVLKFLDPKGLINERLASESYTKEWLINTTSGEVIYHYSPSSELLVRLSLKRIVDLFQDCKNEGSDLFNKNVRSFLKSKSLSEGMIETIKKDPDNFYKYHNGITIVTNMISQFSPKNYSISSPQIVNGAQTVNTISNAVGISPVKLKKASILCKILIADAKLTEKVCETSNTQVKIDLSDLRSNDDIQFELEFLINNIPGAGYKYLRKKPFYTTKNTITLPEFTQWVFSAHFEEPASAKNEKRKLFDATSGGYYGKVCINNSRLHDLETIKKLCFIGTLVRREVSKEKNKSNRSILKSADLHILTAMYVSGKLPTPALYRKVKNIVLDYVKKQQKKNPDITNNFIFTKSNSAWLYIKSKV